MYGKHIAGRAVNGMAKKDEAIENFDYYLEGRFFMRPSMERMLDASREEKAARKAFDENFAALNDKMGGTAESQGGLKDVSDRHRQMLDTVERENAPRIAEIDGKIKAHDDALANLSKIESNGAVMMAELDDAGRRVDDAERKVSEAEKRLHEARSDREIRMRENATKSGPAAWIGKMMEKAGWEDDVAQAEKAYAAATQELSDARANRDRTQADCDQATLEINRLNAEVESIGNDGGIERLNQQRERLQHESDSWRKIIEDEYSASVKRILADYPEEAQRYLELERELDSAVAESDDAYRSFADGYVTNADFNSGCASMTEAERDAVAAEVLEIVRGRFSPSRGVAKDDPIGLDEAKGGSSFEPKRFEAGSYTVSVEKAAPGTECYNYLEDNEYVTDSDRCFIVTGTAGEQWPINGDKLKSKYGLDPDSIEVGERVSASVTGGGNEVYAVKTTEQVLIETAWGDTLIANRNGIPHGDGDMIVSTSPDFTGDVWVVNGEVFEGAYAPEGTAAAGGNGKYGDMDGNEEHGGNGGYSKEFTSRDGHRCRVSKSTGDMQVWVEGYTRVRRHKSEFVGSHWRTVGRAARTVS